MRLKIEMSTLDPSFQLDSFGHLAMGSTGLVAWCNLHLDLRGQNGKSGSETQGAFGPHSVGIP